MSDVDKLREEVLLYQEQQGKLRLWKLVAIGAIASVSLGVAKQSEKHFWLFALIPLVSLYVDLILRQLDLRICIIAKFIRSKDLGLLSEYERAIETDEFSKIRAWQFNEILGGYITIGASLLIGILGMARNSPDAVAILLASIIGILGTICLERMYKIKFRKIGKYKFSRNA